MQPAVDGVRTGRAGVKLGPRLFSTGTILYGAEGSAKAIVNSYEDALAHMRRQKAMGAFSVKSYNQPRREQRQQILKAARELQMLVVPEGGSTFQWNLTHVVDSSRPLLFYYEVYEPAEDGGTELRTSLAFYRGKVKVLETAPDDDWAVPSLTEWFGGVFGIFRDPAVIVYWLGLTALVYGAQAEVATGGGWPCANDEVRPGG